MAKIGRKPTDYELVEGGAGGGRSGGGSLRGGGGSRTRPDSPMSKELLIDVAKGMSPAIVAGVGGIGGAALTQSVGRRRDAASLAAERDKTVVNTENMRRAAAKPKDESVRHYKGMANATKQK